MNMLKEVKNTLSTRGMSRYDKRSERSKQNALSTGWNPEELKRNLELQNEGHDWFVNKRWLTNEGSKFSLPPFDSSDPLASIRTTVRGLQTKVMLDRRRKYWDNVFAFMPKSMIPMLASSEYLLCETEDLSNWVSIGTFAYPAAVSFESPHGVDRNFPLGDYALYESLTEKLKERIGFNLVYVQPVGRISDEGYEVNGTIGDLGMRVWVGEGDGKPLFDKDEDTRQLWGPRLKYSTLVVSPIQKLDGLRNTSMECHTVTHSPEVDGAFHILTVASDTLNAQDYMARADEIREAIGVPGLMVSNSIHARPKTKEGFFLPSGQVAKANKDGVNYTTFTFYSGSETEVKVSSVDEKESSAPASVISGFMPIRSIKSIPRKRTSKTAVTEAA